MQDVIEVGGLVVERGGRRVLHGIDCTVRRGSVTGLLGPNGSGKTTLMRCLVGVQKVRAGSVRVLGRPAGARELRRQVGYVTQAPSVYADLTVRENTRYFAAVYGMPRADADAAVRDMGLDAVAGQVVAALSGGERARASLACALLSRPRILILDEPTVGQDPVVRRDLWARFQDLARAGTTLLVSSHVLDEAGRCDRLLLIRDGRLIADGTPDGVRREAGTSDLEEAFLRLVVAGVGAPKRDVV